MIKRTKHAGTNYRAVQPFLQAADMAGGHKHFTSGGYMDLVVENLQFTDHENRPVYSISHYSVQNGDLMSDPDMEFAVDMEKGVIIPRTFRNDFVGIYQEVFKFINGRLMYSERLLTDLDAFLWQWLKNIKEQGFTAE